MATDRDNKGRLLPGHGVKSPGRPNRVTETAYLRGLSEAVSLEDWREIVTRAVEQAKTGDARARDWLTRYLLGDNAVPLSKLAAWDERGYDPVEAQMKSQERADQWDRLIGGI
jgi:hypothetical protein